MASNNVYKDELEELQDQDLLNDLSDLEDVEDFEEFEDDGFDDFDEFEDFEDFDDLEDYDEIEEDEIENMSEEDLLDFLSDSEDKSVESILNENGDDIDLEKIVKNAGVFDNHVYIPEKVMSITEVPKVLFYNLLKKGIILFIFVVFLILSLVVKMNTAPIILLAMFNAYLIYETYVYYKLLVGGRYLILDAEVVTVINLVDEMIKSDQEKRSLANYKRLVIRDVEGNMFNFKTKLRRGEIVEEGSQILVYIPSVIELGQQSKNGFYIPTILDYELK